MKIDPGMHIGLHLVFFGKTGVTPCVDDSCLPVALRGMKTELVHDAVMTLCLFFNAIEKKVIDEEKLLDLERKHVETLCLLEATFPPSFFDLMLHLTTHLAREI
jgi:hypothetical protein